MRNTLILAGAAAGIALVTAGDIWWHGQSTNFGPLAVGVIIIIAISRLERGAK